MDTPLSTVEERISNEMHLIWAELHKADEFKNTPIEEAFEFRYHALPHMKHQKEQFVAGVEDMREWYVSVVLEYIYFHLFNFYNY